MRRQTGPNYTPKLKPPAFETGLLLAFCKQNARPWIE